MNAIELAMKLTKARDAAKGLLGDQYQETILPYKHIIKEVMKANNLEELPAVLKISETQMFQEDPIKQIMFMAAAVELIEPTKEYKSMEEKP